MTAFQARAQAETGIVVACHDTSPSLRKRYQFGPGGELTVSLTWEPGAFPSDAVFTTELSLAGKPELACVPEAEVWTFPITTTAKSERGLEETVQGQSVTLRWPASLGRAEVRLPA